MIFPLVFGYSAISATLSSTDILMLAGALAAVMILANSNFLSKLRDISLRILSLLFWIILLVIISKECYYSYKSCSSEVPRNADEVLLSKVFVIGREGNMEARVYENSTPVAEGSSTLFVLDPSYLISLQVCSNNKWEVSEKVKDREKPKILNSLEAEGEKLPNEKRYTKALKKVAVIAVVIYTVYKAYHNEGVAVMLKDTIRQRARHLFNYIR